LIEFQISVFPHTFCSTHYLIDPLVWIFGLYNYPDEDSMYRIEDQGAVSFRENSMTRFIIFDESDRDATVVINDVEVPCPKDAVNIFRTKSDGSFYHVFEQVNNYSACYWNGRV